MGQSCANCNKQTEEDPVRIGSRVDDNVREAKEKHIIHNNGQHFLQNEKGKNPSGIKKKQVLERDSSMNGRRFRQEEKEGSSKRVPVSNYRIPDESPFKKEVKITHKPIESHDNSMDGSMRNGMIHLSPLKDASTLRGKQPNSFSSTVEVIEGKSNNESPPTTSVNLFSPNIAHQHSIHRKRNSREKIDLIHILKPTEYENGSLDHDFKVRSGNMRNHRGLKGAIMEEMSEDNGNCNNNSKAICRESNKTYLKSELIIMPPKQYQRGPVKRIKKQFHGILNFPSSSTERSMIINTMEMNIKTNANSPSNSISNYHNNLINPVVSPTNNPNPMKSIKSGAEHCSKNRRISISVSSRDKSNQGVDSPLRKPSTPREKPHYLPYIANKQSIHKQSEEIETSKKDPETPKHTTQNTLMEAQTHKNKEMNISHLLSAQYTPRVASLDMTKSYRFKPLQESCRRGPRPSIDRSIIDQCNRERQADISPQNSKRDFQSPTTFTPSNRGLRLRIEEVPFIYESYSNIISDPLKQLEQISK